MLQSTTICTPIIIKNTRKRLAAVRDLSLSQPCNKIAVITPNKLITAADAPTNIVGWLLKVRLLMVKIAIAPIPLTK